MFVVDCIILNLDRSFKAAAPFLRKYECKVRSAHFHAHWLYISLDFKLSSTYTIQRMLHTN